MQQKVKKIDKKKASEIKFFEKKKKNKIKNSNFKLKII